MKKDWLLFADIILIIAIGLATLYSTVIGTENMLSGGGVVNRQLIFILIGLVIYFVVVNFDYAFLSNIQSIVAICGVVILLLLVVLILGPEINGAKRWLLFGNFQLQPSEFAKLALIISTAWLLSLKNKFNIWKLAALSLIPLAVMCLLIFIEPDAKTTIVMLILWSFVVFTILPNQLRNLLFLGQVVLSAIAAAMLPALSSTFIVLSVIAFVMFVVSLFIEKKFRLMLLLPLAIGIVGGLTVKFSWGIAKNVLQDYQVARIEAFLNPDENTQGSGFQVEQSKVAIGSGMIFGKGFGHGTQSKLNFLPEHQTDFVFAAFAEEFGVMGSLVLISLYAFAIFRIIRISTLAHDTFGSLLCVGIGVKLLFEVFINIGVNLGIMPATGIPLPLMSSGGSMFLATMMALGLVQSVYRHREMIDTD